MHIDIRELLILSSIPGVGSHRLRALINHFRGTQGVYHTSAQELLAVEGIDRKVAVAIIKFQRKNERAPAERYADSQLSRLNRAGGRIVTYWDSEYPSNLKKIYDPPTFIFVRGTLVSTDTPSIAIVGTRAPTPYGIGITERFSADLAALGITVVSGLARGIDTVAHTKAVTSNGRTIAVIGSGIDRIYPAENEPLAQRIVRNGAVISECDMGAKPDAVNFPRRNRIISGISLGTLVIETGINGGAMITAATALDQNREVFAIPSPLFGTRPSGTNLLIKQGKALLTETVEDILGELSSKLPEKLRQGKSVRVAPPPQLSLFEERVYGFVNDMPIHIDAIVEQSGLSTPDALVQLLSLEFKGVVRQIPGKYFVRI